MSRPSNLDPHTVAGFDDEWQRFDHSGASRDELLRRWDEYFSLFPWDQLPADAAGFDLGCGSGRWDQFVAPRVGVLHCIDPAEGALQVARRNLAEHPNCRFHLANADTIPVEDGSMDFGFSLGVLHHIPDPAAALRMCVRKLKPGAPFLVYLYYAFDNRPLWFRAIWRVSDWMRRVICRLPHALRFGVSQLLAATVYWPLARTALLVERLGFRPDSLPLSYYRNLNFYAMRTDALDRFGTRLEHRFTRVQIERLFESAGLSEVRFSDRPPYWCALGIKESGRRG